MKAAALATTQQSAQQKAAGDRDTHRLHRVLMDVHANTLQPFLLEDFQLRTFLADRIRCLIGYLGDLVDRLVGASGYALDPSVLFPELPWDVGCILCVASMMSSLSACTSQNWQCKTSATSNYCLCSAALSCRVVVQALRRQGIVSVGVAVQTDVRLD